MIIGLFVFSLESTGWGIKTELSIETYITSNRPWESHELNRYTS